MKLYHKEEYDHIDEVTSFREWLFFFNDGNDYFYLVGDWISNGYKENPTFYINTQKDLLFAKENGYDVKGLFKGTISADEINQKIEVIRGIYPELLI